MAAPSRKRPGSRAGTLAWLGVGAGVVAWDAFAPETMTDAFRRGHLHPAGKVVVPAAWLLLTGHLFGTLPPWADPIHLAYTAVQNSHPSDRAARSQRIGLSRRHRSTRRMSAASAWSAASFQGR